MAAKHHIPWRKLTLLLAGVLAGCLLVELGLRLIWPQPVQPPRRPGPAMGLRLESAGGAASSPGEFDHDVTANKRGYHDVEHALQKPPGTHRVLVLGDSFVEAVQVPLEKTFCRLLSRDLPARLGRPVEVINLGSAGAGTAGEYLLLKEEGLAYKPDLVLLVFAITNDVYNNSPELEVKRHKPFFALRGGRLVRLEAPGADAHNGGHDGAAWPALLRGSHLLRLARRGLQGKERDGGRAPADYFVFAAHPDPAWERGWEVTSALIEATAAAARTAGAEFALAVLPDRVQLHPDLWRAAREKHPGMAEVAWDLEGPNRRLRSICAEGKLRCLDLTGPLAGRARARGARLYFSRDGHLDAEGHGAVAETLAPFIAGGR